MKLNLNNGLAQILDIHLIYPLSLKIRLVVNPKCRGKGLITDLIKGISLQGTKALSVTACSLFVLAHNKSAIKAYQKAGFILADYPDEIPTENCLYMVKHDI